MTVSSNKSSKPSTTAGDSNAIKVTTVIGTVSAVAALYTLVSVVRRYAKWKRNDRKARESGIVYLPTPAGDSPLFGHIQDFKRNWHRMFDWRLEGFKQANALTFCRTAPIWVPNAPISTCDPVVIKHILKDQFNKYVKNSPDQTPILNDLLGEGIFVVDHGTHASDGGASWTMQRKVAANIFTRSSFKVFTSDVFARHSRTLGHVLGEALKESSIIDMQSLMFKTTLDVIGEVGFGCHLDTLLYKDPQPFAVAFDNAQGLSLYRLVCPGWYIPIFGKLMYKSERELARYIRTLDKFAYEVIRQRRKELEAPQSQPRGEDKKAQDILSLFLAEKLGLSEKLLRDIVMSFMIAGRDTTACTLTFTLLLFAQNPTQQELAREEVNRIMGKDKMDGEESRVATFDEVAQMTYLTACVQESLRLYPPVPTDNKVCVEEDVLPTGGKVYPGQRVSFEPYVMGRIGSLWGNDETEVFKPERWLKMDKLPSAYEFPVFQAGPRICLGQNFAMLESNVVLSFLLHQGYRFRVLTGRDYTYVPGLTISVKDGLFLQVDKVS